MRYSIVTVAFDPTDGATRSWSYACPVNYLTVNAFDLARCELNLTSIKPGGWVTITLYGDGIVRWTDSKQYKTS